MEKSTFEIYPHVSADIDATQQIDLEKEIVELCNDYSIPRDQAITSGNGAFESDLIKLLKSYGFKATMAASETFDEIKDIG